MDNIVSQLTTAGIEVSVYKAYSTSSFYLLLDRGVLKTLRVGDHKGKKKYHYTYEIGSHIREYREVPKTYKDREYALFKYPEADVDSLVTDIRIRKSNLKAKYGDYYTVLLETTKTNFPGGNT